MAGSSGAETLYGYTADDIRALVAKLAERDAEHKLELRRVRSEMWDKLEAEQDGGQLREASSEFVEATEALLDWMNNCDLSADHHSAQPEDYERLCDALERIQAALTTPEEKSSE